MKRENTVVEIREHIADSGKTRYIKNLRWYIVGLLFMATMVNYLDRQTLSIAAPVLREKFHMTSEGYSYITMSFVLSYAIMLPLSGRIIDWLGTRKGFSLAVLWWATANILHSFATGIRSFCLCRFLLGIGESGNFPASVKSVSEWFPAKERALATGIFNMGSGLGAIIAPPLIAMIIMNWGWQLAFVLTGIFDFVWVGLWLFLYRNPEKHPNLEPKELEYIQSGQEAAQIKPEKTVWKKVVRKKEFWACALGKFLTDPVWWFYIFWLPQYLSSARGFSLKEIAMFAWLPFLTADVGSVAGGALSTLFVKRGIGVLTSRKIAMCICALMMPAAIIAVHADNPYIAIACICVATFGHQSWSANLMTLPADLFPKSQVASVFGFAASAGSWGGLLLMWITGKLVDASGYGAIFMIVGLLHVAAAIIIVMLISGKTARPEAES